MEKKNNQTKTKRVVYILNQKIESSCLNILVNKNKRIHKIFKNKIIMRYRYDSITSSPSTKTLYGTQTKAPPSFNLLDAGVGFRLPESPHLLFRHGPTHLLCSLRHVLRSAKYLRRHASHRHCFKLLFCFCC